MTHEREQSHAQESTPAKAPDIIAPGQTTRTAQLVSRDVPIPSGILRRKADANGVADGAEEAVARASSSGGSPLPTTLMRKFEGSLGADLSSVRVHTGAESTSAASAVGAKAYALGQDIHFGAGQYDPASPAGEHLLAHEVAHTVQQAGGAAARQYKLEVSSPGDAHEAEADRAADAMISGSSFGLSGASQSLARKESTVPAAPAATPTPAAQLSTATKSWPKVKDSAVTLPFLGGKINANWGGGGSLSESWEKGVSVKEDRNYRSEVEICPPGILGFVEGGIGASLGAKVDAKVSASSEQAPPPYKTGEMRMIMSAHGGGSVDAKADGHLKLGIGAGIPNVLSATAGLQLALEASATIGVTAGGQLEAIQDQTTGQIDFVVAGSVSVKAVGSLCLDVNVPDKTVNIATYVIGEREIAKIEVAAGVKYDGHEVSATPTKLDWEFLKMPPAEKRQERPATPEEKARLRKAHPIPVNDGASGGGADGPADSVELTPQELLDAGKKLALERLNPHVGRVEMVDDPDTAGAQVSVVLDGIEHRGIVLIDRDLSGHEAGKKKIRRVTSGRVKAIQISAGVQDIAGAQTDTAAEGVILHGKFVTVILDPLTVDYEETAEHKAAADKRLQQQQRDQSNATHANSDPNRDLFPDNQSIAPDAPASGSMEPLPQSSTDNP